MATTEYTITCTLKNVTADKDNPAVILDGGTASLVFDAKTDYPYNAFVINVAGATAAVTPEDDNSAVTVALSAATKAVTVYVEAKIIQDINTEYEIADGVLYIIFNGRKAVRWNGRWLKEEV